MSFLSGMSPPTFKNFQELPEATREYVVIHGLGKTLEERFDHCRRASSVANDNDVPPGVSFIMISEPMMTMLRIWIDCDRDMVRAKLTYDG